jgi:hypothetical protein
LGIERCGKRNVANSGRIFPSILGKLCRTTL